MDFLHTTSQSDLGVFALGLVIAGAVSGLAAGVLGIGGGIVIVPVLYHVMAALGIGPGVRMHIAIATSLAAMIPAALAHVQNAKARIAWRQARIDVVAAVIGGAIGSAAAALVSGSVLALLFAIVALPVVFELALDTRIGIVPPAGRSFAGLMSLSGLVASLTGIAADTISRCLSRLQDLEGDQRRMRVRLSALFVAIAATAAFVIAGWSAPGLPPDSLGYVNLLGFALIAPVLLATEPAGAALAHMMDLRRLRFVFAGLIVIATGRMLWDAFT
ncbi:MAG TPA: TSUP family transporter [Rhizomicrobium sp.]|nr:TSUP family transporter [Rhizomicrobium sp.]